MTRSAILHEDRAAVDMHVHFIFSLSNATYLSPFIMVLGKMKCNPVAPRHDKEPQIIWLGGCFIVTITYFLVKMLTQWPYLMWRGTNCCMVRSSENNSARVQWRCRLAKSSLFFFNTGVRCGFRTDLWYFS